ncbi:hypothetical protein BAUCODRAFT_464810 [Baudoinia panamericana UAMH 10762]|uniref:Allantoin permease n=1 Tax=Baudoinia panamericana (strain UAMH 10762) TaxID=717646 RepID=M2NBA1_BAUPA|nr:uncharacterized protein BAUCODRAFT_464810 [Baudoinia panamericana UAMH 10762]EMC96150.1 hypothetical protein BAUCODRAFT_464810 [Baudoinia panamericana UAMH 10762]
MDSLNQSIAARIDGLRSALSSKEAFVQAFETKASASANVDEKRNVWKNEDLDISPKADRTWRWFDYASFWWTYGFTPGTWSVGSSLVAVGLTGWQSVICIFFGYLFGAIGAVLHSRSAAVYHFGFPVESRIIWGLRGAYFPVLLRALTALIWTGVSIIQGGYFTTIVLRCIFGHSFWIGIENTIPKSAGITVQQLIGLIVYWIATCWILNVPVPKLRRAFEVKAVLLPPVTIALFAWCMWRGADAPTRKLKGAAGVALHGSALGWAMVGGINAIMGKTSTLVVNQPDIARYSKTKWAPFWSQLISLPLGNAGCAALGIFATVRIYNVWGNLDWNVWTLCHDILDHEWNAGSRTLICLLNLIFMFAQAVGDQGANVIPFGADATLLLPRWLNIKRGMWLSYILGVVICPWHILANASGFLTFLGGYSIFLGPILGIFLTDYFVVRKGNVYIHDLFDSSGRYWHNYGIGWRPIVAFIVPVAFVLPGFATKFNVKLDGQLGWSRLYSFSWFFTCTLASVIYFAIACIGTYAAEEKKMPFEALASEVYIEEEDPASSPVTRLSMEVETKV